MKEKTLIVKNFSGSFNEENIGHEIINNYDYNANNNDYYLFYVPPYGSIGHEDDNFIKSSIYQNGFEKIVVFESTGITNILKLKAIALDPKPVESKEEMEKIGEKAKYGKKNISLNRIRFNSDEQNDILEKNKIYCFTYKIKKNNYYNFDKDEIFIWHARNDKYDRLKDISINDFENIFGKKANISELEQTIIPQKNYCYNSIGKDFEEWYKKIVKPLLNNEHLWRLKPINDAKTHIYKYNKENFLKNVGKLYDENLYSEFIFYVLQSNKQLLNKFFSYLVEKYFKNSGYKPSNLCIETQHSTITEVDKLIRIYFKDNKARKNKAYDKLTTKYNLKEENFKEISNTNKGIIDIYLEDDKYRFVIENKILSGINGKHKDIDNDINQLDIYSSYLTKLNKYYAKKENKVILLTPKNVENRFINLNKDVPVLTYFDLAAFFTKYKSLIKEPYRNDFLNAIYKHSYTREEEIDLRFIETLS